MSSLVVVHFEVETLNICIQFITHRFLEGDFDTYTVQMRKPHIWGGEPELLMSSHVLQLSVYIIFICKTFQFACIYDLPKVN